MPILSRLSSVNHFKINFLSLYNTIRTYANTFMFIKCQSLQNQFSRIIQCHSLLRQYLYINQVPITSKSIFSHYTTQLGLTPIPSRLSSVIQFKINFLALYNAIASYGNTFTFIKCQSVQNQFSRVIQCHCVLHQNLHIYQVPITSKSIFSHYTTRLGLMPIPSCLSSAIQFKINFLALYNAIASYANTFMFIKCQSVQNQFSRVIQCHCVLHQYLHIYQVPITSKSIFFRYTCYTTLSHLSPIC